MNLATFVTTYMDEYATKLMNEAININYIDETEYPRIAVMNGKCINQAATPPSIHASEEPMASAPVFQVAFSGEFQRRCV